MLICPKCNIKYDQDKRFCKECGSELIEEVAKKKVLVCPKCNVEYEEGKKFCKNCGSPLEKRIIEEKVIEEKTDKEEQPLEVAQPDIPLTALKSNKTSAFAGIIIATLIAVAGYFGYNYFIVKRSSRILIKDIYATASSTYPSDGKNSYGPNLTLDGINNTAWLENAKGYGIGEWIQFNFSKECKVLCIDVINGYDKYINEKKDRFYQNGRVKSATLSFSDGTAQTIALVDTREMQYFEFGHIVKTSYIRFTINSIYPSTKWEDTGISEFKIWGTE